MDEITSPSIPSSASNSTALTLEGEASDSYWAVGVSWLDHYLLVSLLCHSFVVVFSFYVDLLRFQCASVASKAGTIYNM